MATAAATDRLVGLLVTRPGRVRSPAVRLAVYVLTAGGAGMLAWSGVIHVRLWSQGYEAVPTIGPLFLAQGIGSLALAAALVLVRCVALMAAGAVTLAATAAGLLLSVHTGLFGYRESLVVPYAAETLVIEFAGAAILALAAAVTLVAVRGEPGPGLSRRGRGPG